MRICIVYDCLYPCTVGGAERWYASLARRLAEEGHDVTYLTLRQWGEEGPPAIPGVRVIAVGPRMPLYADGRRRVLPPLVFGLGVLRHLLARGGRYDVVHTASFPYFSVLAAAATRRLHGFRIVVDWFEVWSRGYWTEYLGRLGGTIGWRVQLLCTRVPQTGFCYSRLHEQRLRELGVNGPITRLEGIYDGPTNFGEPLPAEPVIVFAGRHIPEKRVTALVPAFLEARKRSRGCGWRSSATAPTGRRCSVRSPSTASRTWWTCPASCPRSGSTRPCGERSVSCCPSRRRGTGSW